MKKGVRIELIAWIAGMAACIAIIANTRFTTDLSAFLPKAPSAEQKVLVDQLRDGAISRLVLIGIEGGSPSIRAAVSRALAAALRTAPEFAGVHNGDPDETARDREYFFANRYLLSPAVTPERFSERGLRAAIGDSIDLLASPAGMMLKAVLPRDPTGEIVQLLNTLDAGGRPRQVDGAWASQDGERAILLAQTRAPGSAIDAQSRAQDALVAAFGHAVAKAGSGAREMRLLLSGTGVFSVASRETIRKEVTRLALLSTAIIVGLLLVIYRSPTALLLGLLPVASGVVAAIAAVSLGFGEVHGLTLGFGTTLIGEAVDYSIYLFIQSENQRDRQWIDTFWPTIRLGVATSLCGFAALLLSGFPGLAQLGLYSIAGLVVAALVTRFVLPALLPRNFRIRDLSPLGLRIAQLVRRAAPLRWLVGALAAAAVGVLITHRDSLWNHELAALSPVPAADQALDQTLRADLGAPDARYLIVAAATDFDGALRAAERIDKVLEPLVLRGVIAGFDSPSRFLPSNATQQARRAALPSRNELAQRLREATRDLPLRAERLGPFVDDIEAARSREPLGRADLGGTSLAQAIDGLVVPQGGRWTAVIALRASGTEGIDPAPVRAALAAAALPDTLFVDVKGEADRLYTGYLHEAIVLSLAGLAAIVVLLAVTLRSPVRMLRVVTPLLLSVIVVAGALAAAGRSMTLLHLVGMLLIVAVGSNYALFFDRGISGISGERPEAANARMLASLLCANLTTVAGFGLLAFSSVPVLNAIGMTVGPGAVLALVFSAVLAPRRSR